VTGQEGHTKTEEQKLEILAVNAVMKITGRCTCLGQTRLHWFKSVKIIHCLRKITVKEAGSFSLLAICVGRHMHSWTKLNKAVPNILI